MIDSVYQRELSKGIGQTETATDGTVGLSYTSVAVNHLIPYAQPTIGDTLADRYGKDKKVLRKG